MDQLRNFFLGDTFHHYIENGFSEDEARALTWLAEQKPKGKFYGLLAGGFVALTWKQWHQRILGRFGIRGGLIWSQALIIGSFMFFGDYVTCKPRYGANEYFANNLYLNNNIFCYNMQSITQNFQVLNRKFTADEITAFNQRAQAFRLNSDITKRKWIFNPEIETEAEFERRRKLNLTAPWEDKSVRDLIRAENPGREVVFGPKELGKYIDETGTKIGISTKWEFGWRPL